MSPRRILLTGASGGIGAAIAKTLANAGIQLVLVGRRQEPLASLLERLPGDHHFLSADLSQASQRQQLVDQLQHHFPVDGVIHAAGVNQFGWLEDQTNHDISSQMATNAEVPILLTHALLPILAKQQRADIIFIGSVFGAIGHPGFSVYCASKFALRGFSEALHRELANTAIRVHYLAPRAVQTDMNSAAVQAMNDELGNRADRPEVVAQEILAALRKTRSSRRILGWPEALFARINAVLPIIVDRALIGRLNRIEHFARQETSARQVASTTDR